MYATTTGNANTAVGAAALMLNTVGINNTGVGLYALYNSTGYSHYNTAIGWQAGYYTTLGATLSAATKSTFIGSNCRGYTVGSTNEIVIGAEAVGLGSNTAVIGATLQSSATIYGLVNAPDGISATTGTFSNYINTPLIYNTNSIYNYIDFSDGTVRIGDPQGNDSGQYIYYEQSENALYGGNLSFSSGTFTDTVTIGAGGGLVDSVSTALGTTAANQTISQSLNQASYRSVEFFVQASTAGGAYEALKIMVLHDGTNTWNTQYGVIRSGGSLGTYTTTLALQGAATRIRLRVTPTTVDTTYKVMITALPV